ncbi:SseB family protein [Spirillospora sp. CA-294931]|uniref:SseB family protein n=1 Tax=Spirillospora sp. CA-294931 TaxID=3240042 RepID=UPI003D907FD5
MKQGVAIVADAWQPTSELERRLQESVSSGNQEGYFRLLAESELVVPVPPDLIDDVLANEAQPTWPAQEEDGRTFVLVYTSAMAMRTCLGPAYRHFMRLKFSDLADTWPDARWWLAVDAPAKGVEIAPLPIEARLPAWFIRQIADGDTRPPEVGRPTLGAPSPRPAAEPAGARPGTAPSDPLAPAQPPGGGHTPTPHHAPAPAAAPGPGPRDTSPADPLAPAVEHTAPQDATQPPGGGLAAAPGAAPQHASPSDPLAPAPGDEHASPADPLAPAPVGEDAAGGKHVAASGPAQHGAAPVASGEHAAPVGSDPLAPAANPNPSEPVGATGEHAAPPGPVSRGAHAAPGPVDDQQPWEELQAQHRDLPREERRPEFQPANDVERGLLRAATSNDHDLFLQTLADAEVLVPIPEDMDYLQRPGRPGFPWQTREVDGATVVPIFTSPERLVDAGATGSDYIKLAFTAVLRYWPDPGWLLAINSGSPAGGTILAEQLPGLAVWADQRAARRMAETFDPQNEVEQRLLDAARRRDTDAFFKVLLGAQVLVPADPEVPWGITPDDPEFPWRPVLVQGTPSIQVFTSLKWMNEAIGSSRFVMPSFVDIASAWPDSGWTLVINPGTPVDATLPPEQIRALGGPATARPIPQPAPEPQPRDVPAEPRPAVPETQAQPVTEPVPPPEPETVQANEPEEPVEEFEPGNRIDQELYEAALSGDSDAFLRVLMAANVLVPIPLDAPLEVTPVQREFRWEAALRDPSSVQVFTSLVRLREVLPESRFVYADFRELIGSWPRDDWAMHLNPGTRIGASLRGDQVRALSEWAVRVGLVQPRPEVPLPPPSQHQQPVAEPEPEPAPEPEPEPQPVETVTVPQSFEAAPPTPEPVAPRPLPAPDADRLTEPSIMQKVVPHGHVGWYLEQGYDRVGGFVHQTADVAELQTPVQLYETLGLLYDDSPFDPADEGVYVIRWPAYCPDLYRIPFGGRSEEEVAAWGEDGWVIERAPFLGGGFAPGSAGSIREYKVDSVRLPYGAEMYYLGMDRSEQFVAMYDPDRLAWLRPDPATQQADGRTEAAQ